MGFIIKLSLCQLFKPKKIVDPGLGYAIDVIAGLQREESTDLGGPLLSRSAASSITQFVAVVLRSAES